MLRMVFSLVLISWVFSVEAEIHEVTTNDDLRLAIAALQPGDELLLGGGTYAFSSRFSVTVVGLPEQPIVIRAKDGEDALIEMNTGAHNVLEVMDSRYLEVHTARARECTWVVIVTRAGS